MHLFCHKSYRLFYCYKSRGFYSRVELLEEQDNVIFFIGLFFFFFNLYHFISNDMYSPAPLFALFFLSKLFKKKDHLFGLVLISFLFSFWKKRQPLLLWFAHMVSFGLTWVKWFLELVLIFENFLLKLKLLYK